jgi:asparagine synthase (glutamine-hydrolysing)
MQPFKDNGTWVICNGEIFNWKEIVAKYDLKMNTSCDCEVILQLFNHLMNTLDNDFVKIALQLSNELDGEFAYVIYQETYEITIAGRDPYGVRPMFYGTNENDEVYAFCSEIKGIQDICTSIEQFRPGNIMIHNKNDHNNGVYHCYSVPLPKHGDISPITGEKSPSEAHIIKLINSTLKTAVAKRLMSDKEICCLLSGGLDSSLIAGLLSQHFPPYTLKTFSIGMKGSPDLHYAKIVAEHIKSDHTSVELTQEQFLEAIEPVIHAIESYDTTTVRASVGNYLVAKYIKDHTDCKVVFNGDYSDEVCGGYKYMSLCHDENEFHNECIRLVENIQFFDSLRSDRCVSSQGLEARVPFADKDFVHLYKSIPVKMRMSNERIEKYMLRKAFEVDNIIPPEVLWRKKEAFSDGVSSQTNSWHAVIKKHVEIHLLDNEYDKMTMDEINPVILKETAYYKGIFKRYFSFENIIPYYWLPKYCKNATDPSAREIMV